MTSEKALMEQARDAAALIEMYYERGWTDGLPVVPPHPDSVNAALAAADLRGHEILGEIPARNVQVTAQKVAVNAVLAGCLAVAFPVAVKTFRWE